MEDWHKLAPLYCGRRQKWKVRPCAQLIIARVYIRILTNSNLDAISDISVGPAGTSEERL